MKRAIALFLVAAMSLSLCACGLLPNAQSKEYEKYQTIIDNLENGNYQNAIELIENMAQQDNNNSDTDTATEDTKPALTPEQIAWQTDVVGTWIPNKTASEDGHPGFTVKADGTCIVDGKSYTWEIGDASETNAKIVVLDGQTKVHDLQFSVNADYGYKRAFLYTYMDEYSTQSSEGNYYRNEDYIVVEITSDNWQDYFEVKEVISVRKNAFDEIDQFCGSTYFRLKDSYGAVNGDLSSGGMEHKSVTTCQDITVNLTDLTYVPVGNVRNTAENNSTTELRISTDANDARYYGCSIGGFIAYDVNKNTKDTVWRPMNIEILRVEGTLYIVK